MNRFGTMTDEARDERLSILHPQIKTMTARALVTATTEAERADLAALCDERRQLEEAKRPAYVPLFGAEPFYMPPSPMALEHSSDVRHFVSAERSRRMGF